MLGPILIAAGVVLMIAGAFMLQFWTSGKATWFDQEVLDNQGRATGQRRFVDLLFLAFYFLVLVILPLFAGGLLIISGLVRVF